MVIRHTKDKGIFFFWIKPYIALHGSDFQFPVNFLYIAIISPEKWNGFVIVSAFFCNCGRFHDKPCIIVQLFTCGHLGRLPQRKTYSIFLSGSLHGKKVPEERICVGRGFKVAYILFVGVDLLPVSNDLLSGLLHICQLFLPLCFNQLYLLCAGVCGCLYLFSSFCGYLFNLGSTLCLHFLYRRAFYSSYFLYSCISGGTYCFYLFASFVRNLFFNGIYVQSKSINLFIQFLFCQVFLLSDVRSRLVFNRLDGQLLLFFNSGIGTLSGAVDLVQCRL